jgi:uncharacterized protein (TIGR02246 family)
MKTKRSWICGCLTLLLLAPAGLLRAADENSAIEKALRDLDAEWSAAAASRDLDKTMSYYSNDAIVLAPNAVVATTKEAIREGWKNDFAATTSGSWKASRVEVSRSGDMAYVSGTYEMTLKSESGKPGSDHGKYLEVWEKQADGKWKCGADMWNSDVAEK